MGPELNRALAQTTEIFFLFFLKPKIGFVSERANKTKPQYHYDREPMQADQ